MSEPDVLEHRVGDLAITVDDRGARLRSLRVGRHELLVTDGLPPFGFGAFLMAPFAGRVRDATATVDGRTRRFEREADGHAIHGLVHSQRFDRRDGPTWTTTIDGDRWFGRLELRCEYHLDATGLRWTLCAEALDGPVPATVGWHPWFRRRLAPAGPAVRLQLPDARLLPRDDAGIATTTPGPVPPGPYDDTFVELAGPVILDWPGQARVTVTSDAPATVIYTELDHAICVEPQTGPPDEVNLPSARLVEPGRPLVLSARLDIELVG